MLLWAYPIAAGLFVARNIAWLGNQIDSTLPLPWCYLPTLWRPDLSSLREQVLQMVPTAPTTFTILSQRLSGFSGKTD
jgi:hypothetical protein